jgi:hypothetical protein
MAYKRFLLAILTVIPAQANDILADQFPTFSTEAWVQEAAVANDDSIFVKGAFTSVNGIPRPGLAKLGPNGSLDLEFAPRKVSDLSLIDEFGSQLIVGWADPPNELFPLSGGRLIRSLAYRFEVRQSDGSILPEALSDLKDETSHLMPQFENDGKLWLISRSERNHARIIARDSETLEPLSTFDHPETYPAPPFAVSPAGEDKIWVLGRTYHPGVITSQVGTSQQHVLFRINPDGSVDSTFNPEELPAQKLYRFEKSPGPGTIISSIFPNRFRYWPTPSFGSRSFTFRDEDGIQTSASTLSYPFGFISDYLIRGAEVLAFTANRNDQLTTDGSILPDAPTTIPLDTANLATATTNLDLLSNGNLLVGGSRRILDDGSLAPTWQIPRFEGRPTITRLTPLRNERVLVNGDFDFADGLKRRGGVVLYPDGTLAPSFNPDLDLRRAISIKEKRNGNFLVMMGTEIFDPNGVASRLLELDENGTLLRGISLAFAGTEILPDNKRGEILGTSVNFDLQPDDSIILWVSRTNIEVPTYSVWRIPANDPENHIVLASPRGPGGSVLLLPDGRLIIAGTIYAADESPLPETITLPLGFSFNSIVDEEKIILSEWTGSQYRYHFWNPDDGVLSSFDLSDLNPQDFFNPGFSAMSRDKLLVANTGSQFPFAFFGSNLGFPETGKIARLHPDGRIDPTFKLSADPQGAFLSTLERNNEGSPTLWVAGSFSSINGVSRDGIALVSDSLASGFQEWMQPISGNPVIYSESGNEDGDALTNLEEYAAGTDPFRPSRADQIVKADHLTWQIPCNPDAPEIRRRIKVSDNLIDWRPASANEIRLETRQSCLTWTLRTGHGALYSRLRISR